MAPQKVMYGVERSKANYCNMQWYYSISYESLSLICDSLWWQLKVYFNLCPFIGAQEQEKIYRQHLLCWDQAATVIFLQLVEGMSLIPPLNSPWWNIQVQNSIIWHGKSLNLVISSERIEWHTIYEHCTDAQGMLWEWFLLFQTPKK